ncbi:hypothetical protein AB0C89_29870 [Streptomyces sp. NPDC048491]|uniref:hypothetical protein n=1 Tax=Streptomyces sp. NPDC048491 TaxID=3157207 RepID=UPI003431F9D5
MSNQGEEVFEDVTVVSFREQLRADAEVNEAAGPLHERWLDKDTPAEEEKTIEERLAALYAEHGMSGGKTLKLRLSREGIKVHRINGVYAVWGDKTGPITTGTKTYSKWHGAEEYARLGGASVDDAVTVEVKTDFVFDRNEQSAYKDINAEITFTPGETKSLQHSLTFAPGETVKILEFDNLAYQPTRLVQLKATITDITSNGTTTLSIGFPDMEHDEEYTSEQKTADLENSRAELKRAEARFEEDGDRTKLDRATEACKYVRRTSQYTAGLSELN